MGQKTINISKQNEKLDLIKASPELDITHTYTHTRFKFERYSFVSVATDVLLRLDE